MAESTLNFPPFPPLSWDDFVWSGDVVLPTWVCFKAGKASPDVLSSRTKSKGAVTLSVSSVDSKARSHPMPEQAAAFQHLLENEAQVVNSVIEALVEYCPGDAYDGDNPKLLNVKKPAQLRPLVSLSRVHVLDVAKNKFACIGFDFRCDWDEEHGAGVMTHQGRVIATGQADCSFTQWIAQQCLDKKKRRKSR